MNLINKVFTIAENFDAIDLENCGKLTNTVKMHLLDTLQWNFHRQISTKNFKFLLGLACAIGGHLFKNIPDYVRTVQKLSPEYPVYQITKEVMQTFFTKEIANSLFNNMSLIHDTTYALIETHMKRKSKIKEVAIKASFELLSLISDEKEDFDGFTFSSMMLTCLKPQCYEVFRKAAMSGD